MEYLLHTRLQNCIGEAGLASSQYGFRPGRSTVQALEGVRTEAEEAARRHRYCVLVTYNVKNAYNSVRWRDMFQELGRRNVPRYIRRLLFSYFSRRRIMYLAGGRWRSRLVHMGVPQGSIIGPFLWIVFHDGIFRVELPPGCRVWGFADDVGLVVSATTLEGLRAATAGATDRLAGWLEERGLAFNIGKTEWTFLNNKVVPRDFTLEMRGVQVSPRPTVKYLGVLFERRWTFRPHIEAAANRALKMAASLARLMANLRGPAGFVRRVYWAIAESVVLYAAPVWAHRVTDKKTRDILRRVQRAGLARVACAYKTASTDALCVLCRIPPITLKVQERARLYENTHRLGEDGVPRRTAEGLNNPNRYAEWRRTKKEELTMVTMVEWEEEWRNAAHGRWTHRLLPA